MNRRELIKMIALASGTAVIGGEFLLSGCKNEKAGNGFLLTAGNISFLDEVGETIIPKTNTPGAKDAEVGKFMALIVADCYEEKDQKVFKEGIDKIDATASKKFSTSFLNLSKEQKEQLLTEIDAEAKTYQKNKKPEASSHYYTMMKQLTLFGFFTSKPGATEALRYVAIPGRWEGCVPYTKGEKAWAV